MAVLKRLNNDTLVQWFGIFMLALGFAIISIAAGLIVLGSLTLAYGTIREVVRIKAASTEEPVDDGVR